MRIKVMSFNIRHGAGMDGQLHLERTADVIKAAKADVIGIQEADKYYGERSDFKDQMLELASMLNFHYCYGPNIVDQQTNSEYGNGILSRYPITTYENILLPSPGEEPRGVLKAHFHINGSEFYMLCTHLGLNEKTRLDQMKSLVDISKEIKGQKLLVGDFNTEPKNADINYLLQHTDYQDAFGNGQDALTFPSDNPTRRIDYLFIENHMNVHEPRVIQTDASDHLPISAEITRS